MNTHTNTHTQIHTHIIYIISIFLSSSLPLSLSLCKPCGLRCQVMRIVPCSARASPCCSLTRPRSAWRRWAASCSSREGSWEQNNWSPWDWKESWTPSQWSRIGMTWCNRVCRLGRACGSKKYVSWRPKVHQRSMSRDPRTWDRLRPIICCTRMKPDCYMFAPVCTCCSTSY